LKIVDFGLAKRVETLTAEMTAPTRSGHTEPERIMGTAGYMSPEQVKGFPVDHRSDIFSFGTILYELLSGKRAFKRETNAETMAAIMLVESAPGPRALQVQVGRLFGAGSSEASKPSRTSTEWRRTSEASVARASIDT
jgi:serine/threonine protein kinase